MAKALYYPKADRSRWYGNGNATVSPTKVLWHTTETPGGLPGYADGTVAPNLTYDPWARKWWQHFPLNGTARALKNGQGYQTNRQGAVQIEVSCYCDPSKIGTGKHVSRISDAAYQDMAEFAQFMRDEWGVPLDLGVQIKPYPASYGASNGVRLSRGAFTAYRGHCAHQHAPDNLHGDSGGMDIARIVSAKPTTLPMKEDDMAKAKLYVGLGPDGKPYTNDDYSGLFVPPNKFIGLTGGPVTPGRATDVYLAQRFVDFYNKDDDNMLYATEVDDIKAILARA